MSHGPNKGIYVQKLQCSRSANLLREAMKDLQQSFNLIFNIFVVTKLLKGATILLTSVWTLS